MIRTGTKWRCGGLAAENVRTSRDLSITGLSIPGTESPAVARGVRQSGAIFLRGRDVSRRRTASYAKTHIAAPVVLGVGGTLDLITANGGVASVDTRPRCGAPPGSNGHVRRAAGSGRRP